jgi:hypothetical protein
MVAPRLILQLIALSFVVLLPMLAIDGSTFAAKIFVGVVFITVLGSSVFWATHGRRVFPPNKTTARRAAVILSAAFAAACGWWAYALHLESIENSGAWGCDPGVGISTKCTGLYGPPGFKYDLIYGSLTLILLLIIFSLGYLIFYLFGLWIKKS